MISCQHHDYIEIACLYRYHVRLSLLSGDEVQGIAVDTVNNNNKEECIKIRVDDNEQLVVLNLIVKMKALADNPHFSSISFKD